MTGQSRKVTKQRQRGQINIHEICHRHVITTTDWTANVMSIEAFQQILYFKKRIFHIWSFLALQTNLYIVVRLKFRVKWERVLNCSHYLTII